MPIAVALLEHPAAPYALLVATVVAAVRATYAGAPFVPAFCAVAAGLLASLASITTPPPLLGVLLFVIGVALLNVEFALPTYGCAGACGLVAALYGSWLSLVGATPPTFAGAALRTAGALLGTLAIAAVVLHGWRRRTLPPSD